MGRIRTLTRWDLVWAAWAIMEALMKVEMVTQKGDRVTFSEDQ